MLGLLESPFALQPSSPSSRSSRSPPRSPRNAKSGVQMRTRERKNADAASEVSSVSTSVATQADEWEAKALDADAFEDSNSAGRLQRPDVLEVSEPEFEELAEQFFLKMRDGVRVKVTKIPASNGRGKAEENCDEEEEVKEDVSSREKSRNKLMFFFLPLGASGLFTNRPLVARYGGEYDILTWCYRGLFESDEPVSARRMSIRDHAEDAREVLLACGYHCADVVLAHSMGVQVALEYSLLYPDLVKTMVLMNGAHGHVFSTAFQPFMRIPYANNISEWLVRTVLTNRPHKIFGLVLSGLETTYYAALMRTVGKLVGTKTWTGLSGEDYFAQITRQYLGGVSMNEKTSRNYCQFFQELDAHSVQHLMHKVEHPVLLLSGRFDYFTPPYHMSEMARVMPNAEHRSDWLSTHFTIIENPDFILRHASDFLAAQFPAQDCDHDLN
ncbi:Epoxide hydrolase 3 [Hondaea fermentalgiana]|uniref:Epoxide hydrolase 3 n=1 Tax=Hondaea fermentalgiana TaxID=2315210 RepID=A0A2R5GWN8_9STRA|nr:Epoxide hydrolase 3 [Hondaea fermentalgiana]|eukprot:GBG34995.1 Epoxide hydrolase 3 [Hondaea fermentalgiana]